MSQPKALQLTLGGAPLFPIFGATFVIAGIALLPASGLAALAVRRRRIGPRGTLWHHGTSARVGVVASRSWAPGSLGGVMV